MGRNVSLYRATSPCSLDTQQDHPESHRELQNLARAEGISADIEDKIKGKNSEEDKKNLFENPRLSTHGTWTKYNLRKLMGHYQESDYDPSILLPHVEEAQHLQTFISYKDAASRSLSFM